MENSNEQKKGLFPGIVSIYFQDIFKIFLHNFKHSDSKYPFKAILDLDDKHISYE